MAILVRSMADGTVENIGFDERALPKPDPRTGKPVKGWGRYIVIRHEDGSKSLYAHLQKDGTLKAENEKVKKGEAIARADNTGGSTGAHLHVEYAPDGKIYKRGSKVDAKPCIDQNVEGSITVRDNGRVADDAFRVAIDGRVVCETSIGASNTCGVGSLRPGTVILTITAIIAPDNIGTYEVTLADGLKFADGTTQRSGSLSEGGSASFQVTVPE